MLPERLEIDSSGRRAAFVLRRDLHAVHDWDGSGHPVHSIPAARVAAFEGEGAMPVYELTPGGTLAYPTGKIWVRFEEGTEAASRAADLERAGFRIERVPKYAPNGAFVTAADAAFALSHLDALRAVGGIEHVEPQMLLEASF